MHQKARTTRVVLAAMAILLGVAAICGQAIVAMALSQASAVAQFSRAFEVVYGEVPAWSALVFSLQSSIWAVPVTSAALLAVALARASSVRAISLISVSLAAVAFALAYAMYPLHLLAQAGSRL